MGAPLLAILQERMIHQIALCGNRAGLAHSASRGIVRCRMWPMLALSVTSLSRYNPLASLQKERRMRRSCLIQVTLLAVVIVVLSLAVRQAIVRGTQATAPAPTRTEPTLTLDLPAQAAAAPAPLALPQAETPRRDPFSSRPVMLAEATRGAGGRRWLALPGLPARGRAAWRLCGPRGAL